MRNPLATLDAVRLDDPAIDKDKSDLDAYAKTHNPKHLKYAPGASPVLFKVKQLPASFCTDVLDRLSGSGRLMTAFQAGVHEIVLPDGNTIAAQREHMIDGAYSTKLANERWLDIVRAKFGRKVITEMGSVACAIGDLSDEDIAGFSSPVGDSVTG